MFFTRYWTHEKLHRATLLNFPERVKTYASDGDEKKFIQGALKLQSTPARERADFTNQCIAESLAAEAEWLKRVEAVPAKKTYIRWHGMDSIRRRRLGSKEIVEFSR